jgi:hypothetical protein
MDSNEEFSSIESRNPDVILQITESLDRNEHMIFDENLNLLSKENDETRDPYDDEKICDISHVGLFVADHTDVVKVQEDTSDASMDVPDLAFNSTFDKDADMMHAHDKSTEQYPLHIFLYIIIFGFISLLLVVNVYTHLRFSMHPEISWTGSVEIDLVSNSKCQEIVSSLSGSSTCNPCNGGLSKFVCYPSYIFMH